jgi:hypothetical protein
MISLKGARAILGIELALLIIFTSSNFLLFTWGSAIGYYLLILLASFFGGTLIVDFNRSLKLVSIAYIASCIALISLYALPAMLYGEAYPGEINIIVAITATNLSKIAIISFPISVFTCLFGCFSGRSFAES